MSSHILELVIYELKKVFNKKIIAGGQTTVVWVFHLGSWYLVGCRRPRRSGVSPPPP
jgi:hypothetical protein